MVRLIAVLLTFVVAVPVRLLGAFVLSKYWQWFAVDHLGWKPISYSMCLAVLLLMAFFNMNQDLSLALIRKKQAEGEDDAEGFKDAIEYVVVWGIVAYPLTLLLGWLWHWGMS